MFTLPSPYQLRPMQLSDLPHVRTIERLSLPTPTKAGSLEHELNHNRLAHYQVLTAKDDAIIGYSGYWLIVDELHITIIAIHPDWRRRSLGELLLLNIFMQTQEEKAALANLEVRPSNTVAQSLYHKYSFSVIHERPRYYRDGESALVMTADLPLPNLNQLASALFSRLQGEP